MKKLFFSALVALVAGSAAYASVGTSAPGDVYYKINEPNGECTLVPDCYTGPGVPCTIAPSSVYYIDGCLPAPQANFR